MGSAPVVDEEEYIRERARTAAKDPEGPLDKFVEAVQRVLPEGFSWWNRENNTVGNTRICKCPTAKWTGKFAWAAEACGDRFFAREISMLQPRAILITGKAEWQTMLSVFGITTDQFEDTADLLPLMGRIDGRDIRIVAAHHLTRKLTLDPVYLERVKALLTMAISARSWPPT